MSSRKISVLGCGWLGLPLAQHLIKLGFSVKGSTTSHPKLETLRASGVLPYLIRCQPHIEGENIDGFFDADILFVNIPFKRDLTDPLYYKQQIQAVIDRIENSALNFVVFASSTSVYPENNKAVSEDLKIDPPNFRAQVLLETESLLMRNDRFDTTVLRFAGLYGQARKIGSFLSGQDDISKPNSPVNLIHLDDCIGIVIGVIEKNIRNEIINACSDDHPTRKELYTQAALKQGFEPPKFAENLEMNFKVVSNHKLKELLDYEFKYPNPLEYLNADFSSGDL